MHIVLDICVGGKRISEEETDQQRSCVHGGIQSTRNWSRIWLCLSGKRYVFMETDLIFLNLVEIVCSDFEVISHPIVHIKSQL